MNPTPPPIRTSSEAPVGVQLAERLSDFVKAFAIYPENNARVRANLDALMETIEAGFDDDDVAPRGTITLSIHAERVRVGSTDVEIRDGTNVGWLKNRLERSILAGLKFLPGVPRESVIEFTRQLLEQYTRRQLDVEFEQLWPEQYPGLELVHRMFEGVFSPLGVHKDGGLPDGSDAAGGLSLDLSEQQVLADALAGDEGVRAHMARIEARLAAVDPDREGTHSMDLLGRLSRLLPAEAMHDPAKLVRMATAVLDEIAGGLEGAPSDRALLSETRLGRLLFAVGHRVFAREGVAPAEAAERLRDAPRVAARPRLAERDAEITDDVDAFRREIGALPALDEREAAQRMTIAAEQLGVYLHFLVEWDLEHAGDLGPRVAEVLEDAGPPELEVLASYLRRPPEDASEESLEVWRQRYRRITSFLLAAGEVPLMRSMGFLGTEEVARSFPEDFVLFLHSLDPTSRRDVALCAEACGMIGGARLTQAAPGLAENGGLLHWDLPRKLLAWPLPELLPLAQQILAKGGEEMRPAVVAYLRSLGVEAPEACLLRILRDAHEVPRSYLFGLMQLISRPAGLGPGERRPQTPFNLLIAREIGRFVRSTEGDAKATERRAYAVRFLGIFQGPESKALLRELAGRRWSWLSKVPALVRRAARTALQHYK